MTKFFGWWTASVTKTMTPGIVSSIAFGVSTTLALFLSYKGYPMDTVGVVVGAFFFSSFFGTMIGGYLTDRYGAQTISGYALLLEGLGFIGYGLSSSPKEFFISRLFHGLGYGFGQTPAAILLREALRYHSPATAERGKAYGKTIALLASGVASLLSPYIIQLRPVYFVLLAGISIVCFGICIIVITQLNLGTMYKPTSFSIKKLVSRKSLRLSLTGMGPIAANAVFLSIVPLFLGGQEAGLTVAVVILANGFCGSLIVRLREKWGDKRVVLLSRMATLFSIPFLLLHQDVITLIIAGIFVGFGIRGNNSTLYEIDQDQASPEKKGTKSSSYTMGGSLISWLAVSSAGMIVHYGGYPSLWWTLAALAIISIIIGAKMHLKA